MTAPTNPPSLGDLEGLATKCERAAESYDRVLNMDGGQAQATAAGLWASLHGHLFEKAAASLRAIAALAEGDGE